MSDIVLTPTEKSELARMLKELHDSGYRDITEHESFRVRVGARIRHRGHQWDKAYTEGTGFIVALTEKPDSPWTREWRLPDIELIALWDKPRPFEDSSRLSGLAQYHVEVIEVDFASSLAKAIDATEGVR